MEFKLLKAYKSDYRYITFRSFVFALVLVIYVGLGACRQKLSSLIFPHCSTSDFPSSSRTMIRADPTVSDDTFNVLDLLIFMSWPIILECDLRKKYHSWQTVTLLMS